MSERFLYNIQSSSRKKGIEAFTRMASHYFACEPAELKVEVDWAQGVTPLGGSVEYYEMSCYAWKKDES